MLAWYVEEQIIKIIKATRRYTAIGRQVVRSRELVCQKKGRNNPGVRKQHAVSFDFRNQKKNLPFVHGTIGAASFYSHIGLRLNVS